MGKWNNLAILSQRELEEDELDSLEMELEDLYQGVCDGVLFQEDYAPEAVLFLIVSVQLLLLNGLPGDGCKKYFDLLRMVREKGAAGLDDAQRAVLCFVLSQLAWELNDPAPSGYIQEAAEFSKDAIIPISTRAAVLFLGVKRYGMRQAEIKQGGYGDLWVFDVFVLKKAGRHPVLQKAVIPQAEEVSKEAAEFLGIFQSESAAKVTVEQMNRKEALRLSLYQRLVEPILPLLEDVKQVFLASDGDIINLPFDILGDGNGKLLGERFQIVKMECARDFLFGNENLPGSNDSLIMGNSLFQIDERKPVVKSRGRQGFRAEEGEAAVKGSRGCLKQAGVAGLKGEEIKQLPFFFGICCLSAWLIGIILCAGIAPSAGKNPG